MEPRAERGDAPPPFDDGSGRPERRRGTQKKIDLNADIGESSDIAHTANDERLLRAITSVNIACGFHAGDPSVMRHTVRAAVKAGVSIGAHPSFRDCEGFGRREMELEPRQIVDLMLYQIGALSAIARAENATVRHVKPHGALYNMSVKRPDVAEAVARAVASFDDTLRLVGLPGSALLAAGSRLGLPVAAEGFADRAYESDGSLTPRHVDGAVLINPTHAAERAVRMARDGLVVARDGTMLSMHVDTICVHGDTPGAAELAAAVREGLERAGITVAAL